jgi:hypothetical protein
MAWKLSELFPEFTGRATSLHAALAAVRKTLIGTVPVVGDLAGLTTAESTGKDAPCSVTLKSS